jgi:hypothetical protein
VLCPHEGAALRPHRIDVVYHRPGDRLPGLGALRSDQGRHARLPAHRVHGLNSGGIGAIHALARQVGLIDAINQRLHLLHFHFPYHESDHVLTLAYNVLCDGTCLQDLERRRHDEVFLDALGARRIPDPTTAGDFCRRFDEAAIRLLQDIVHDVRIGVWAEQPADFFTQARIDMDGFLVETTGQCKQGMNIGYDGTWGYHALVLTLANTGEVLGLVNRPANRPSSEGAAAEVDRALAVCFRGGFQQVLLRGDTKFSQTEHLDRWHADPRVRFLFGYEARDNVKERADALPETAWQSLQRPLRYTVQTRTRQRPDNVKEAVVVRREFENIKLRSEQVAEFRYRPTACRTTYRMIVVRKNLSVEKGERRLFDQIVYFFYLTNDWDSSADEIVFGQPGVELGVHGDDGVGLGPEGVVGVAAAGNAGPLGRKVSDREALGVGVGVQDVRQCLHAVAVPVGTNESAVGVPTAVLEPSLADLLPPGGTLAVLSRRPPKSASGCADPPQPHARPRRKEK